MSPYDIDRKEGVTVPVLYGLCDGHLGTNAARYLADEIEEVGTDGGVYRSSCSCADTTASPLRETSVTPSRRRATPTFGSTATRETSAAARAQS